MLRTKLSFIILSLMTKLQRQTNLNDTSYYTYSNLDMARDYEENLNNSDAASALSIEYIDMVTAKILVKGILDAVYSQGISLNVEHSNFSSKESHSNATSKYMQTNDVLINENNFLLDSNKNTIFLYPFVPSEGSEVFEDQIQSNNEASRFAYSIYLIDKKYSFMLVHLINHLNKNSQLKTSENHYFSNVLKDLTHFIITKNIIKESLEIKSINDLESLYEEFRTFKSIIWKTYSIGAIIGTHSYKTHYKNFLDAKNKDIKKSEEEVLQLYIDAFNSENYNFLSKIFPGVLFAYKILNIKYVVTRKVAVIKLLQLIICKFEAFRSQYFFGNPKNYESLKVLEDNFLFKETVAIIFVIFKGVMEICNCSNTFIEVLEIYSFACFIRAKYPNTFLKIEYFKSIVSLEDSKIEIVKSKTGEHEYLEDLRFLSDFKSSLFYSKLSIIIKPEDLISEYTTKLGNKSTGKRRRMKMKKWKL